MIDTFINHDPETEAAMSALQPIGRMGRAEEVAVLPSYCASCARCGRLCRCGV
jgi:hypothetical protein